MNSNPKTSLNPVLTHLESAIDGTVLEVDRPQTMHAGRPLWARYDLDAVGSRLRREDLTSRPADMWRWRELLPIGPVVTLDESITPLLPAPRLGRRLGVGDLLIKDESRLPTGSFKARGQATAISMAKHYGIRRVAIPTAGNAGGAMAAYAARAGIEAWVFMPADTPRTMMVEASLAGARVVLVDGLIGDCGAFIQTGREAMGWFDISTLKEPWRLEGKKTMGLELAEQLQWQLPDVILYPTGGGTGLIGMVKAFDELEALGWIEAGRRPRMVAVQSDGCCPLVTAFEKGERFAVPHANAETVARGLCVPAAVGDFMVLDALAATDGRALAVPEAEILAEMGRGVSDEGISFGPESAACLLAAAQLASEGWISPEERVVIFNCGALQKYSELPVLDLPRYVAGAAMDWEKLSAR